MCFFTIYAVTGHGTTCRRDNTITTAIGYLASFQRSDYGPGTAHCPWTIDSDNKRLNITLYKFVPLKSPMASSSVCFEIGTMEEGGMSQGILSCGTDPRQKVIYQSKGTNVRIHFKDNSFLRDLGNFVLQFQGKMLHFRISTKIYSNTQIL